MKKEITTGESRGIYRSHKTGENQRKAESRCRLLWTFLLVGALFVCASCGRKDTVALETEEIVSSLPGTEEAAGAQAGAERLAQTAAGSLTPEDGIAAAAKAEQEPPAAGSPLPEQGAAENRTEEKTGQASVYVHICGAVRSPGVYEFPFGSRVYEAVEKAGGFTEKADENYVNLSLPLEDGWKIEIPTLEETESLAAQGETQGSGENRAQQDGSGQPGITKAVNGAESGANSAETGTDVSGKVNINTASAQTLCGLPGIGESRAQGIIAYREKNGGFSHIEDIMKIEGIKEGMFSKLKDKICVR